MSQQNAGAAAAATGLPGHDLTWDDLRTRWAELTSRQKVVGFYGHNKGEFSCFSNFYDQAKEPFDFEVPQEFFAPGIEEGEPLPRTVSCAFSEKAIMLCKAAVMGDAASYRAIACAKDPREAKWLGRSIGNFNNDLWRITVCAVAFQVVYQKFSKTPRLQPTLLGTGDKIIAEVAPGDCVWGIGMGTDDERVATPSAWQGSNILGWALMEAREVLKNPNGANQEAADRGRVRRRW
jgi:ribA/ribD-fused uncharacterized protein